MAIQCTPFCIVCSRDPPTLLSYQHGAARVTALDQQLRDSDEFAEIRVRLVQAQVTMKNYQDQSRRAVHYAVGDWV